MVYIVLGIIFFTIGKMLEQEESKMEVIGFILAIIILVAVFGSLANAIDDVTGTFSKKEDARVKEQKDIFEKENRKIKK